MADQKYKHPNFTLTLDDAALRKLQTQGGAVDDAVKRAAGRARDYARENLTRDGRVDTGRLRNSIRYEQRSRPDRLANYAVGSDLEYAIYQEEGTRAHGPRRAKVMRFKSGGKFVFARWVRGVTASHFLRRAKDRLTPSDFGL